MAAGAATKSILIVEDDDDIRRWVSDGMRAAGYAVRDVGLAEKVPAVLRSEAFDLLLLDLGMPLGTMQGMELLTRLRETEGTSRIPVVILSGYGDLVNRDITGRLGVAAILSKPLRDITQLVDVVRRVLA